MEIHKFLKTFISITLLLFVSDIVSHAQFAGDSILENENAIQRPLTLHKYQFRVSSGLYFYIVDRQYDEHGNKKMFSDIGKAVSITQIPFNIKYGLLDFLEIEAGMNYNSTTTRERGLLLINTLSPMVTEVGNTTYKQGFQDLSISLNGRVPGSNRTFGSLLLLGIDIPVSRSKAQKPNHNYVYDLGSDTEQIRYNFNEPWSSGSPSFNFGSTLKLRFNKFGAIVSGSIKFPLRTSEGGYWLHRKIDSEFIYTDVDYSFLAPQKLLLSMQGKYLLFPWFTADMEVLYLNHSKGWTEQTGKKVASPSIEQFLLNPGFEILITQRFWLQQKICLTLTGENALGFIGVETVFLYNLFVN